MGCAPSKQVQVVPTISEPKLVNNEELIESVENGLASPSTTGINIEAKPNEEETNGALPQPEEKEQINPDQENKKEAKMEDEVEVQPACGDDTDLETMGEEAPKDWLETKEQEVPVIIVTDTEVPDNPILESLKSQISQTSDQKMREQEVQQVVDNADVKVGDLDGLDVVKRFKLLFLKDDPKQLQARVDLLKEEIAKLHEDNEYRILRLLSSMNHEATEDALCSLKANKKKRCKSAFQGHLISRRDTPIIEEIAVISVENSDEVLAAIQAAQQNDEEKQGQTEVCSQQTSETNLDEVTEISTIGDEMSKQPAEEEVSKEAVEEEMPKTTVKDNVSTVALEDEVPKTAVEEEVPKTDAEDQVPKTPVDEELQKLPVEQVPKSTLQEAEVPQISNENVSLNGEQSKELSEDAQKEPDGHRSSCQIILQPPNIKWEQQDSAVESVDGMISPHNSGVSTATAQGEGSHRYITKADESLVAQLLQEKQEQEFELSQPTEESPKITSGATFVVEEQQKKAVEPIIPNATSLQPPEVTQKVMSPPLVEESKPAKDEVVNTQLPQEDQIILVKITKKTPAEHIKQEAHKDRPPSSNKHGKNGVASSTKVPERVDSPKSRPESTTSQAKKTPAHEQRPVAAKVSRKKH